MRFRLLLPPTLAVLAAAAPFAAGAQATTTPFPAGSTWLISGTPSFDADLSKPTSGSFATSHAISGDGRYVTFESSSDNLSSEDDDASRQVYVKDRQTGALTLVSRQDGVAGAPVVGEGCRDPSISRNGQWVVFTCETAIAPHDTNARSDIYIRSWQDPSPQTILVSHAPGLDTQDGDSSHAVVSENGDFVAFQTDNALVINDVNNVSDVYRAHLSPLTKVVDAMSLVSRASNKGGAGNQSSYRASISDNGQRIGFTSNATNLDGGAAGTADGFVSFNPGLANNTTQRVAGATTTNAAPGRDVYDLDISGDGAYVTYTSASANLTAADTTDDYDVFLRAISSNVTSLVSTGANVEATGGVVNRDGTVVAFGSDSTSIDPDATTRSYRNYVSEGGKVRLVSRRDGDAGAPNGPDTFLGASALDDTGKVVVVSGDGGGGLTDDDDRWSGGIYVRDRSVSPATTRLVSRPAGTASIANAGASDALSDAGDTISADGRRAVYSSTWDAGIQGAAIIVRDTQTGAKLVASRADGPGGAIDHTGYDAVISADGNRVAWSSGDQLDPADHDDNVDVYVRDLTTNRTYLASVADDGTDSDSYAAAPDLDATGNRVLFSTASKNLGDGDTNIYNDVHVRDLAAGHTYLVSARDGSSEPGDNASYGGDISADGARVAFESGATDLGGPDTDTDGDVFLRDLTTRSTTLVSARASGSAADGGSSGPSISADGTRVAFSSTAGLVDGVPGKADLPQVYVRDLRAGSLELAGRADGPSGGAPSLGASEAAISADGRSVAFASPDPNLGVTNPKHDDVIYVRDLAAATTTAASTAAGGGAPADRTSSPSLTADGACVLFTSRANLLGTFVSPDFDHVYLRALKPGCVPALASGGQVDPPRTVPAKDATAPVLSKVSATNVRFRASSKATALRASAASVPKKKKATKTGTTFTLTLSEAATVTVAFETPTNGKRTKGTCRATKKRVSQKQACTLYKTDGQLTRSLQAGARKVEFTGRLGKVALRPGVHRVTIRAVDGAGNASRPKVLTITVVR